MKIRLKLTLQFSVLVAFLLLGILFFNYFLAHRFANESFEDRLKARAVTVAEHQLKGGDQSISSFAQSLPEEVVVGFDQGGRQIFRKGNGNWLPDNRIFELMKAGREDCNIDGQFFTVCFPVRDEKELAWLVVSARDDVGNSKLRNLAQTMMLSFLGFLFLVVLAGQYLSEKALQPIQFIINQVNLISVRNLDRRVTHLNNRDEIAQLAQTFNLMLDRLEASFKTQSDFVRNSSHELRNPLAAMIGQAEIALKKDRSPEYYKEVVQAVFQESLRLKQIVNNLLHLSMASPETVNKTHEPLRLDELLLDVVENLMQSDQRRKIEVQFQLPTETEPIISGSKSLLEVAIGNILENACKFSDYQKVKCELLQHPDGMLITVKDIGIGMSPEEIERITEPFFRSGSAREKEGFGIGMAVASRVFQVHGISMEIFSKPCLGTEVRLHFPAIPSPAEEPAEGWPGV